MSSVELPKLVLIENLGYLYPNENSKQKKLYGIYECGLCGTHFKVQTPSVNNGATKSCGCYLKSQLVKINTTHGGTNTKLYRTWFNIKERTTNKNNKNYLDYGGRGITICDEWKDDFAKFREWALANGYEEDKGLSIDRIDNDGNYEPINCRWTTQTIQNRNKRMNSNNISGYRGVSFYKNLSKFKAQISVNTKKIHIGYFETIVEGAIAYNTYIIENNLEGFILNVIPKEKGNYEQD